MKKDFFIRRRPIQPDSNYRTGSACTAQINGRQIIFP